jgi:hypothetical protein
MTNKNEEEIDAETIRFGEVRAATEGQLGAVGCGPGFGRDWPKLFRSLAAGALEALSEKEKAELGADLDTFERAFRRVFAEVDEAAPHLSNDIVRLFISATFITKRIGMESLERALGRSREEIKRHLGDEQAKKARDGKRIPDACRAKRLNAAIVAEAKAQNRAMAISMEFAELIRPGVCYRLGEPCADNWPSAWTIKAAIRKLKNKAKKGQD